MSRKIYKREEVIEKNKKKMENQQKVKKVNKKYLKIIIILLIIFTGFSIGIIIAFSYNSKVFSDHSKANTKLVLYKYDIEELDYSIFKPKVYEIHYTANNNNSLSKGESTYTLNEDGTCSYYHKLVSEGTMKQDAPPEENESILKSTKCNYSIDGENFSVNMIVNRTDSGYIEGLKNKKYYSNDESSEELNLIGKFSDNYKYLSIGKLQYSSPHYNKYLEKYMSYVLINPKTTKDYDLDGTSIDSSENSINISNCKIVDKTK